MIYFHVVLTYFTDDIKLKYIFHFLQVALGVFVRINDMCFL